MNFVMNARSCPNAPKVLPWLGRAVLGGCGGLWLSAQAATPTWDAGAGSGDWSAGGNWNPDGAIASGDTLLFDTSGFTAHNNTTAAGNVYGLTFNPGASAFVIGGNSIALDGTHGLTNHSAALQTFNNPFSLSGTVLVSPAAGNMAIAGDITGSGSLTKSGAATLTLSGSNAYTGTTLINAGTLAVTGGSVNGSSHLLVRDGGALSLSNTTFTTGGTGGNFTVGYQSGAGTVTVGSGATLNVGGGGGRVFIGGGESGGPYGTGVLTVQPGGTVNIAAAGAFPNDKVYLSGFGGAGTINLDGGFLNSARELQHGAGGGPSVFNFNGGTYRAQASLANFLNANLTQANVRNGGAIIDSNGFNITIPEPLLHSTIGGDAAVDGGLIKNGAGMLTLTGFNTLNGPTSINAGTLRLSSPLGSIWTASPITVNPGAVLEFHSTAANDATPDWPVPPNLTGGGTVNKTGSGWVHWQGTLGLSGQINVLDGILSGSTGGASNWTGITADLHVASPGKFDLWSRQVSIDALTGNGTVANGSGTSTYGLTLGVANGSGVFSGSMLNTSGTLALTKTGTGTQTLSGTLTHHGQNTINNGTLEITGSLIRPGTPTTNPFVVQGGGTLVLDGTISVNNGSGGAIQVGISSPGTLNVIGGTVTTAWANGNGWGIGNTAAGTVNITGGTVNHGGNDVFYVGWTGAGGAGTLNLAGTGVLNLTGSVPMILGQSSPAAGTVNLDSGGQLRLGRNIVKGTGTGTFNFNGGTLEALASSTSLMSGLTRANVRNGGANLDTGTFDITIGQALLHSDLGGDAAVDGGLTKTGSGTLTLSSLGSYNGQTRILDGSLAISATSALNEVAGSNGALGIVPSSATIGNILIDGGTLQNSVTGGDLTLHANRGIQLGTSGINQVRAQTGGSFFRYSGVIRDLSAPASLTIASGAGGWIPGGQSLYSGGTILASGSTSVPVVSSVGPAGAPVSGPFGVGTLTLAGGQLRATTSAAITLANPVVISADTTFPTNTGEKSLHLSGPVTLQGGTRTLNVGIGASVASEEALLSGAIGDGGSGFGVTKTGAGTLTLGSAASTYTGPTSVQAGVLRITSGSEQALGANPPSFNANQLFLNGGTVQASGSSLTLDDANRGIGLGASGGTFSADGALTFTLSNPISGPFGQFNKAGAGTVDLTGGATLGGLNVNAGTLRQSAGTVQVANPAVVASGATYSLSGGKLRVDSLVIDGGFDWGAGALGHFTSGTSLAIATDYSSSGFQEVGVGRTLAVTGDLGTGAGSVMDLTRSPSLYESFGIRFNNVSINGDFSLDGVGDELRLDLNPYLLRPFSTLGTGAIEYGSLPLVTWTGADPAGTFDQVTGITDDGRGFTLYTFAFSGAASLDVNTYFLEYDSANNTLWFHYKVNGYVPEPDTFLLGAIGAGLLRLLRTLGTARRRITG
jgi:autotransporter-associated beta strand protein